MIEKINKSNKIMGITRHSYTYLDEKSFRLLYKALVRPNLEYCNQIWQPHIQKHVNAIENVQRRASCLLPGFKDPTYEERLWKLKLPSFAYRRISVDMIETYKIATEKYDPLISNRLLLAREHQEAILLNCRKTMPNQHYNETPSSSRLHANT